MPDSTPANDLATDLNESTSSGELKGSRSFLVSCVSISPMLQNRATDELLDDLIGASGRRRPVRTDISHEKMAEEKLHLGPNGEFGIPVSYVFASLVEAGRKVAFEGKTRISTLESTLLPSFLTVAPALFNDNGGFLKFVDQKKKWVVDKRRGVNRTTKGATGIVRPKFMDWAVDVPIIVDLDVIAIEKVQELFRVAGTSIGWGDFRPEKRGDFGRFRVKSFTEMEREAQ